MESVTSNLHFRQRSEATSRKHQRGCWLLAAGVEFLRFPAPIAPP